MFFTNKVLGDVFYAHSFSTCSPCLSLYHSSSIPSKGCRGRCCHDLMSSDVINGWGNEVEIERTSDLRDDSHRRSNIRCQRPSSLNLCIVCVYLWHSHIQHTHGRGWARDESSVQFVSLYYIARLRPHTQCLFSTKNEIPQVPDVNFIL